MKTKFLALLSFVILSAGNAYGFGFTSVNVGVGGVGVGVTTGSFPIAYSSGYAGALGYRGMGYGIRPMCGGGCGGMGSHGPITGYPSYGYGYGYYNPYQFGYGFFRPIYRHGWCNRCANRHNCTKCRRKAGFRRTSVSVRVGGVFVGVNTARFF